MQRLLIIELSVPTLVHARRSFLLWAHISDASIFFHFNGQSLNALRKHWKHQELEQSQLRFSRDCYTSFKIVIKLFRASLVNILLLRISATEPSSFSTTKPRYNKRSSRSLIVYFGAYRRKMAAGRREEKSKSYIPFDALSNILLACFPKLRHPV